MTGRTDQSALIPSGTPPTLAGLFFCLASAEGAGLLFCPAKCSPIQAFTARFVP
nr:MAG TPA: hypothetical protein [Caudoviricetes sp.]